MVKQAALALTLTGTILAQPPKAKQVPHVTDIHGQKLVDNYFWMRDKEDPDTLAYLKAENRYLAKIMGPTKPLQEKLYTEMLSRIQEDDQRAPYRVGKYGYFARTRKGRAYPIFCRTPWGKSTPVEVLLDVNQLAKGQPYMGIGLFEVSPDSHLLAYASDNTGYRQYKLHFKDLRSGHLLPDVIERVTSMAWCKDNRTIFFTTEDPVTKRSDKFWKYSLGDLQGECLYVENDELFELSCHSSRDLDYVLLSCDSKTSSECRYRRADSAPRKLEILKTRQANHEYSVDHWDGSFIIRTNLQAPLFKLVQASDQSPSKWQDLLVLPDGTQVDRFCLFPGKIAVSMRREGVPGLGILDRKSGEFQQVNFREQVRSLNFAENEDPHLSSVRVEYESPITPPTTFDVSLRSGKLTKIRQRPVPNYQPGRYSCQRWTFKARDGVTVPVTLVYRKGMQAGLGHPTLLEGYGSYGSVDDPYFSSINFSLLDRGVVYAYAHIRGGGELGEPWRQAGRMMQKKNTFNDFVDCAEQLIKSGWSRKDGLVISGTSAGGLLVGAAVNQRPDLFRAVIANVPFVDVINTMLDASLPLTTGEWIEWGNPNEKPAFDYMMGYSPYDNIRPVNYPSMLVKVSWHDSQVPYWEGAKFVAKLRALKTDQNTILLQSNLKAGHGGSSGRYERLREYAFDYAYVLWQLGVAKP
jgi:oligopeptidase B